MRLLLLLLLALVGLIQYPLWVGRGGWLSVWDMQQQVASQRTINEGLRARNQALSAEVEDLRTGTEAAEERARAELSMMRQGELFVQILPPDVKAPEVKINPKAATATKPAPPAVPAPPVKPATSAKPR
jgi:cell division protein FtsB